MQTKHKTKNIDTVYLLGWDTPETLKASSDIQTLEWIIRQLLLKYLDFNANVKMPYMLKELYIFLNLVLSLLRFLNLTRYLDL